jgi:hypothetical protein
MRQLIRFTMVISLLGIGASGTRPSAAADQTSLKEQLLGTWMLVGWAQLRPDGSKFQMFCG